MHKVFHDNQPAYLPSLLSMLFSSHSPLDIIVTPYVRTIMLSGLMTCCSCSILRYLKMLEDFQILFEKYGGMKNQVNS